ncbi:hypothetical protein GVAV_002363 [Gurleya vavrai]
MLSLFIIKELTSFLRNRRLRINRTVQNEQDLALLVYLPTGSDLKNDNIISVQNNDIEINKTSIDFNIAQGEAFLSNDQQIAEVKDVKAGIKIENCCDTNVSTKNNKIQNPTNFKDSIPFIHSFNSENFSYCEKKHKAIYNQNVKMIKNNEKFYIKIKTNSRKNIGSIENENTFSEVLLFDKGLEKDIGNNVATDSKKLETNEITKIKLCFDSESRQKERNNNTVEILFNDNGLLIKDDSKNTNLKRYHNKNYPTKSQNNIPESTLKSSYNTKNISGNKAHLSNRHLENKNHDFKSLQKSTNLNAIRIKENKNQNHEKDIFDYQRNLKKKNKATSHLLTDYLNDLKHTKIYLSIFQNPLCLKVLNDERWSEDNKINILHTMYCIKSEIAKLNK